MSTASASKKLAQAAGSWLAVAVVGVAVSSYTGCDSEEADYDPCVDRDCGDECQLCPPDDPDCNETPATKLCDEGGVCSSNPVTCS